MEDEADLYAVLGLKPEASAEAIRKAYHAKALLCHPDKRPDDPLAAVEFQRLQKAYDILSDEKARNAYDELLSVRKARVEKENRADSKRRKMMEDLKNRENFRKAYSKEKEDEERAVKQFQKEVTWIRATRGQRGMPFEASKIENNAQDQERMLKVSWKPAKNGGSDYSSSMLKDIFLRFGCVEDVVILDAAKQSSALVVMSSRNEMLAAIRQPHSPLSVEPLVPHNASSSAKSSTQASTTNGESTPPVNSGNLVGNAFHDHEDSILKKMPKPYTQGNAKPYQDWCTAEEKKNRRSYKRVLSAFRRDCRVEFVHVPGSRFHAARLLRDFYHGYEYHGRFYVSMIDGSTMFSMGQILTVVLDVESLEEALLRAGITLNEAITMHLEMDQMTALPSSDLVEYTTEGWDQYIAYEAYIRVDADSPSSLCVQQFKKITC